MVQQVSNYEAEISALKYVVTTLTQDKEELNTRIVAWPQELKKALEEEARAWSATVKKLDSDNFELNQSRSKLEGKVEVLTETMREMRNTNT